MVKRILRLLAAHAMVMTMALASLLAAPKRAPRINLKNLSRRARRAYYRALVKAYGIPAVAGGAGGSRTALMARHTPGGVFTFDDVVEHPADIYFVDSGATLATDTAGAGATPDQPFATIDFAIGQCVASQGDVIYVLPGHSETLTAIIALDVIGVSVVGLGLGTLRPQLTLGADINGVEISAANCKLENILCNERTVTPTGNNAYVDIQAAGAVVKGFHFDCGVEDLDSITIASGGDEAVIEDSVWRVTADGPDSAIRIEAAGVDKLTVRDNFMDGGSVANAWDDGDIVSGAAHTLCQILSNRFLFMASSKGGIEFTAAATGLIQANVFAGGTLGQMLDPGSCICVENYEQDAIDESARLFPAANPSGAGGGTQTILDQLSGAVGIPAFPAAVAYGNDVSLAEVIAYIQDQIRPPAGGHIPGMGVHVSKAANMQATTDDVFDITGLVLVTLILGEVTSALDGTVTTVEFRIKTSNDAIFAATTITSDLIKTLYLVSGQPDSILNGGGTPTPNVGALTAAHDSATDRSPALAPMVMGNNSGTEVIEQLLGAADVGSGAVTWHLYYIPLEASAAVAASA